MFFNISSVSSNQHIRMISEWSSDTEVMSAEHSAYSSHEYYTYKTLKIENYTFKLH